MAFKRVNKFLCNEWSHWVCFLGDTRYHLYRRKMSPNSEENRSLFLFATLHSN